MKNIITIVFMSLVSLQMNAQEIFKTTAGEISFFSETPMENIDASNKNLKGLLNTKNGEMAFVVTNVGFEFDKPLMGEHFNENYIESDKYKVSVFKGKITESINYTEDGEHKVSAKGTLDVHGVVQERSIEGKLVIKNNTITLISEFNIKLADHKIKIPKIVTEKIAETVKVTVNLNLEPKK